MSLLDELTALVTASLVILEHSFSYPVTNSLECSCNLLIKPYSGAHRIDHRRFHCSIHTKGCSAYQHRSLPYPKLVSILS